MTRAEISPNYYWRFAFISAICLGLAGWSLYDGIVAWPNQKIQAEKYIEIKEQNPKTYKEVWKAHAAEQGWSEEWPGEPKSDGDIGGQFVMAALAGPIGLLTLFIFLRSLGQWMEMDEQGIRTSRGQELKFEEMTLLDKKKWQKKGIARLYYERDGRRHKMIIDDYKFDRAESGVMIRHVESLLGEERIVNGLPEPPLEEPADEVPSPAEEIADAASETVVDRESNQA